MKDFRSTNIIEFGNQFKTDKSCLRYLANNKWSNGYKCRKCGCGKYSVNKDNYTRQCHSCHDVESPTANTLFHKNKFGLQKAFFIVFEMSTNTKGISTLMVTRKYGISYKTAWFFMQKVREAMKSSESMPIKSTVQVDEFVFGGKEDLKQGRSRDVKKKKIIGAVELTDNGKVKRAYFKKITDFTSNSLQKIFDAHVDKKASVKTDKWTGYIPISKEYNISQQKSDNGQSMKQIHIIIHQLKSWLRSTYSWMHEEHIEKYLSEYSYRINRSSSREIAFHNLILRMLNHKQVYYKEIIIRT